MRAQASPCCRQQRRHAARSAAPDRRRPGPGTNPRFHRSLPCPLRAAGGVALRRGDLQRQHAAWPGDRRQPGGPGLDGAQHPRGEPAFACAGTFPDALRWNAASMLYSWCAREARRRGWRKIITYTRADEPVCCCVLPAGRREAKVRGRGWHGGRRARSNTNAWIDKVRWAKTSGSGCRHYRPRAKRRRVASEGGHQVQGGNVRGSHRATRASFITKLRRVAGLRI